MDEQQTGKPTTQVQKFTSQINFNSNSNEDLLKDKLNEVGSVQHEDDRQHEEVVDKQQRAPRGTSSNLPMLNEKSETSQLHYRQAAIDYSQSILGGGSTFEKGSRDTFADFNSAKNQTLRER